MTVRRRVLPWCIRMMLVLFAIGAGAGGAAQTSSGSIAILAYHRFDAERSASTTVTIKTFESQLTTLAEQGYQILPLERVVDVVLGAPAPSPRIAAITVDDGHRTMYEILFPIVRKRQIPITLFIYPSAISHADYALTWEQLQEMQASGLVDIQSHTYWHPDFHQEKKRRPPADYQAFVRSQLVNSRNELERRLHSKVDLLAWPYGIVDAELEDAAKAAGYRAALGFDGKLSFPGDQIFAIHRIPMWETRQDGEFAAILSGKSIRSFREKAHDVEK